MAQLLQTNRPVNLQVLKVLNATSVAFQGQNKGTQFSITLNFSDVSQFTPGSRWSLQTSPVTHELQIKPLVTGHDQAESAPVKVARPADTTSLPNVVSGGKGEVSPKPEGTSIAHKAGIPSLKSLETTIASHRHSAAIQQNSLNGVFAGLSSIVSRNTAIQSANPGGQAITDIAKQILGFRLTPDVTSQSVKQAIQSSGIFHEAQSSAPGIKAGAPLAGAPTGAEQLIEKGDLKQQLLDLKSVLLNSGQKATSAAHKQSSDTPPLPERDGQVLGQKAARLPQGKDSQLFMSRLLDQAVEGIARLKLLQFASLPQPDVDTLQNAESNKLQFNMELPLALTPDQTAIIGLRITRDGHHPEHDAAGHGHGWSIDMAMDTDETGAIDAHIHLAPKGLRVTVWAEDEDFSNRLKESSESLKAGLSEEGLDVDSLQVLRGRRLDLSKYAHHNAGYFFDGSM